MKSEAKGYFPITLENSDGEAVETHLRYTMESLWEIEEKYGPQGEVRVDGASIGQTAFFIWAGLRHDEELADRSPKEIAGMIPFGRLKAMLPSIKKALEAAFGAASDGEEGDEEEVPLEGRKRGKN